MKFDGTFELCYKQDTAVKINNRFYLEKREQVKSAI